MSDKYSNVETTTFADFLKILPEMTINHPSHTYTHTDDRMDKQTVVWQWLEPVKTMWERNRFPHFTVFQHVNFDDKLPYVVVSSHVDTINYPECFCERCGEDAHLCLGNLDNSLTNAVAVAIMRHVFWSQGNSELLSLKQVIFAFTEGEETGMIGAKKLMDYVKEFPKKPDWFVVLDVTTEGVREEKFWFRNTVTLENLYVDDGDMGESEQESMIYELLKCGQHDCDIKFYHDGAPDEAYVYGNPLLNFGLGGYNTFSLCYPVYCPSGMHSQNGIYANLLDATDYIQIIETILKNFD